MIIHIMHGRNVKATLRILRRATKIDQGRFGRLERDFGGMVMRLFMLKPSIVSNASDPVLNSRSFWAPEPCDFLELTVQIFRLKISLYISQSNSVGGANFDIHERAVYVVVKEM
ncbi:hypothetical protein OCU04_005039 [Sclerotinia nivalis]|uniref:Uncharacterized protein n=1 Tax=Sclerotinia nivalis TaxID=352851 RepID=A0A9X0ARS1_9HELO|nr:hypothetical protein OCU04_005039 [Sclerotinia nivalis]